MNLGGKVKSLPPDLRNKLMFASVELDKKDKKKSDMQVAAVVTQESPALGSTFEDSQIDNVFGLLLIFSLAAIFTIIVNKFTLKRQQSREKGDQQLRMEDQLLASSDSKVKSTVSYCEI